MPRSVHGGRHELGQNFLMHPPSIDTITTLVAATRGPILELGAGNGALTRPLAAMGRPLTAIDIDEHRVRALARTLPDVHVVRADATRYPLRAPVVVGNIPFHLTTPILRRLLNEPGWARAVLVTQWEVARKRAGVGGHTMMTAQSGPWFTFELRGRVPSWGFNPRPSVDGGILAITRRGSPLVAAADRRRYEHFVRAIFTGRGGSIVRIIQGPSHVGRTAARRAISRAGVAPEALPRDLSTAQWVELWCSLRSGRGPLP